GGRISVEVTRANDRQIGRKAIMTAGPNPIDGFVVDASSISYVGDSLQRPECILAERDGSLWAADARGGVMHIRPDGSQRFVGLDGAPLPTGATPRRTSDLVHGSLPNGLAFARNGELLIANFGTDALEIMSRDGGARTLYDHIDGAPLGKVNFVLRDRRDRLWVTVSTRIDPWTQAICNRL